MFNKKYKNKHWKKQKGKGKGVFTIHFRLKTFLNKEKEEGEEQTIFLFHRDHLSEAPIKYPAKNIWGDLWLARRKYIFGLIFSLQSSYTFAQKL